MHSYTFELVVTAVDPIGTTTIRWTETRQARSEREARIRLLADQLRQSRWPIGRMTIRCVGNGNLKQ